MPNPIRTGTPVQRWLAAPLAVLSLVMLMPTAVRAAELPRLPEGVASFGAAVAGDQLYIFGGHVGKTHQHSVENLNHRFQRLDLRTPQDGWQTIGDVDGLQGLPLVAHGRRVCRVGGLAARNHAGEDEDLVSTDAVACYHPETGWQALPPLPAPRSSHDAALIGDALYVAGGWQLRGAGQDPRWHDSAAVLDLAAAEPAWRAIPQPFQRRALAVAAAGGRLYACGGLDAEGTSRQVDVYDPATERWHHGPELPAMTARLKGFGVAAFGVGERLYLSGADGVVHRLAAGAEAWQTGLGKLETPRFFHRLLPHGTRLLFVAGAAREGHLTSVESLALADLVPGTVDTATVDTAGAPRERGTWPGFRGHGDGQAPSPEVPLTWSAEHNLAWRAPLPGYGQSAPVVWGEQVLVTSVDGAEKEELILSALDLDSGAVRWRRRFAASRSAPSSDMVSRGAPTPVVDGERIYAFWESGDLIALDHRGETLWRRSLAADYGDFEGNHGIASSPVLSTDAVLVQITHQGPSYLLAVDQATGVTRWKVDRPAKGAWTTPVVVAGSGGPELISSAAGRVEGLDAASGERLWHLDGIEKNNVPSAVVDGDLVVVASSEPGHSFALHRSTAAADAAGSIAWRAEGVASGFGSPLIHGGCALFVNRAGVLTCLDLESGEKRWSHRLGGESWASPIAAGEHVFIFAKDGATTVLRPSADGPEVVAENRLPLDDTIYGAAAVRGALLIRAGRELARVGRDSATAALQADAAPTLHTANHPREANP